MKTEHGVPIPRSVATLIVVGYAAGACAMLAFVIDGLPRRGLVLSVAVGIAGVAFVAAYLLMGQTRRHTRVLRATLGYRRGERPWRQHALQAVAHTFMLVSWILLFFSDDSDRRLGLLFPFWLLSVGVLAISAVQKRRHERSDRERFGPPESYEAAQRFG